LYADPVEYRSGISSCSYLAITAPKFGGAIQGFDPSALILRSRAWTVGDFLAADSVGNLFNEPTVSDLRWRLPRESVS